MDNVRYDKSIKGGSYHILESSPFPFAKKSFIGGRPLSRADFSSPSYITVPLSKKTILSAKRLILETSCVIKIGVVYYDQLFLNSYS
jgi:hypothetical protein